MEISERPVCPRFFPVSLFNDSKANRVMIVPEKWPAAKMEKPVEKT
jgi:hypothetical protein